jgi:hypothetical protein
VTIAADLLDHARRHAALGGTPTLMFDAASVPELFDLAKHLAGRFPSALSDDGDTTSLRVSIDEINVAIVLDGVPLPPWWTQAEADAWSLASRAAGLELVAMAEGGC